MFFIHLEFSCGSLQAFKVITVGFEGVEAIVCLSQLKEVMRTLLPINRWLRNILHLWDIQHNHIFLLCHLYCDLFTVVENWGDRYILWPNLRPLIFFLLITTFSIEGVYLRFCMCSSSTIKTEENCRSERSVHSQHIRKTEFKHI